MRPVKPKTWRTTNFLILRKSILPTKIEFGITTAFAWQWLLAVKKYVVTPLLRHPRSMAFRKPVDAKALGIFPIYNQVRSILIY